MQAGDFRGMSHEPGYGRPMRKQQVGVGEAFWGLGRGKMGGLEDTARLIRL